ncbi:MAG: AmmeMemoRadiSam system protein B [Candidatus Magasanikbacteria bacterium]|nr:AmmeMemoRadiSam system protein B [Candidatus Magasanikbacteria bacterium]|tara:strand:+ start:2079 stop:2876 length:798 start_codon:yes stop_codon:yes gene_type:complete
MSLVFAAITPHSPLLIPGIGKEQTEEPLQKTREALKTLEQEMYTTKPDTIVIISPHEGLFDDTFIINAHTHFSSSYETFADFNTQESWKGDPDLAAKISHVSNKSEDIPVRLISEEKLSHGSSVPLHFLTAHNKDVRILPIGFSNLSPEKHIALGVMLKDIIMNHEKKIAVIASGDLSHTLSDVSPSGFNAQGATFDETLIRLLEENNIEKIIAMDPETITLAKECGYRSLLILLGIIKNMKHTFTKHAYEHPFGIGYLTSNFVL